MVWWLCKIILLWNIYISIFNYFIITPFLSYFDYINDLNKLFETSLIIIFNIIAIILPNLFIIINIKTILICIFISIFNTFTIIPILKYMYINILFGNLLIILVDFIMIAIPYLIINYYKNKNTTNSHISKINETNKTNKVNYYDNKYNKQLNDIAKLYANSYDYKFKNKKISDENLNKLIKIKLDENNANLSIVQLLDNIEYDLHNEIKYIETLTHIAKLYANSYDLNNIVKIKAYSNDITKLKKNISNDDINILVKIKIGENVANNTNKILIEKIWECVESDLNNEIEKIEKILNDNIENRIKKQKDMDEIEKKLNELKKKSYINNFKQHEKQKTSIIQRDLIIFDDIV